MRIMIKVAAESESAAEVEDRRAHVKAASQ